MGDQSGSIVTLSHIGLGKIDDLPDAASVHVAKTIRNRKSNCDASCGKDDGGCENCGSKSGASASADHGGATESADANGKSAAKTAVKHNDADSPAEPDSPNEDGDKGKSYSHIIEVEFKSRRKQLYRNEKHLELALGDLVVVEAERGLDAGRVSAMGRIANEKMHIIYKGEEPLFQVVRKANKKDQERYDQNKASEKEAFSVFKERIKHFTLDMKGVDAEWQFDHHRLTLFFTAPRQVDFRSLVRDLAAIFTTRIELRQISPRDEAKRVGGVGICGRELCCSTFLNRFEYITLEHAREQQLAQNPTKLSGLCGRLKCCLLYEIDYYTSALKNYPPLNSTIVTADGAGKMFKIDIFRDEVHLYYGKSGNYGTLSLNDLNALRREGKVLAPGEVYVEPPEEPKEHDLDKLDATNRGKGGKRSGRGERSSRSERGERSDRKRREDRRERPVKTEAKDVVQESRPSEPAGNESGDTAENREKRGDRSRRRRRGGRGRGSKTEGGENQDAMRPDSGSEHEQVKQENRTAGDKPPAEGQKDEGDKKGRGRGGRRSDRRRRDKNRTDGKTNDQSGAKPENKRETGNSQDGNSADSGRKREGGNTPPDGPNKENS